VVTVVERPVVQMRRISVARAALGHPEALEHALVGLAAAAWLLLLTPDSGGFHRASTAIAAVAAFPALMVTRPWQRVPRLLLAATGVAAAGAVFVLMTTPAGWQQSDSPAAQLFGLLALVITIAYCRTPARRTAVAVVLLAALALQLGPAWWAWQGSADPNHLMVGTFYWHNQLGAWMTALGLFATAIATAGSGRLRTAALVLAPFANVCVVLSTSRTSLGLLVLGQLVVLALALGCTNRGWAVLRWAATVLATAALLLLLTSTLFFDRAWEGLPILNDSAGPTSVVGERGTSSLAGNGGDRFHWTAAALDSWVDSPVAGRGFGSFKDTQVEYLSRADYSTYVHNAYAEALTSGGLVFGAPILLFAVLVGVAAVRALVTSLRRTAPERAVLGGAAIACGVLLLHAGLDFDWQYPSLVALLGVAGGLLFRHSARPAPTIPVIVLIVAVLAVVVGGSLVASHGRQALTGKPSTERLLDAQWPLADDPRLQLAALRACVRGGSLVVPRSTAERAVRASARAATLDAEIAQLRRDVARLISEGRD
jgi:hypothetical protein